jgi:hypothetical protein
VLQVLHPLEVGDDDAAGVGEDVRHHQHAVRREDLVRARRRRAVRPLHDDAAPQQVRVARVQHAVERRGDERVALEREQLLGRDAARPLEGRQGAARREVRVERVRVEAAVGGDRARRILHADDPRAEILRGARGPRADVAEPLHDDPHAVDGDPEPLSGLGQHHDDPAARRRLAPVRAAERDRLAGDRGGREPVQLPVLVHDPRHHLRVGVDVGRGDVALRPEQVVRLVDELAGDLLELVAREQARVAVDAALRAAERHADDRGLPRHQLREGADLVEVDLGVESQAALVRAARAVVLDAVARERVDAPVRQPDGDLHAELAVGAAQDLADVGRDAETVRRDAEPVLDRLDRRDLRGPRNAGRRRWARACRRVVRSLLAHGARSCHGARRQAAVADRAGAPDRRRA